MAEKTYLVEYHVDAVAEYGALRDRQQKKGVLTVASFLQQLGPKITEPHAKPVKGTAKLFELRPGGGKTLVRPLYFRYDETTFKILAIAPEAQTDGRGFEAAIERAKTRAKSDYGCDV